jgi:hypothetical protein
MRLPIAVCGIAGSGMTDLPLTTMCAPLFFPKVIISTALRPSID